MDSASASVSEQHEHWLNTPARDDDFAAWAVRSLFRATRERVGPAEDWRGDLPADAQSRLEQQLVDCQWELALQHELLDHNPMLTRALVRRGAAPSRDMEPVVAYVRSPAGRAFVREHFLGCLAVLVRQLVEALAQVPAAPDLDGVVPSLPERVASALNARLARHTDGLRALLGLPHTDTGELLDDSTIYRLLDRT